MQPKSFDENPTAITKAIVFVSVPNVRIIFKQELRRAGITDVIAPMIAEDAITALLKNKEALLIVDQQLPMRDLNQILKVANGTENISTRPIFYLANVLSAEVLGICSEYNISRIHPGELSKDVVQRNIMELLDQESEANGIRTVLSQVKTCYDLCDYDRAEELLMPIYEGAKNNVRIICELAETYVLSDQWQSAESLLEKHVKTFDANIRLQHQYARCHMKAGRFAEAEAVLKECDLINPYNVERLLDLGTALLSVDKIQEAYKSFNKALALEPHNIKAKQGIGQCNLMLGEVNEGLKLLRQVTSDRELAAVFNNSAILSVNNNRYDIAITLYETAISTLGKNSLAGAKLVFNLGLAYHKKGNEEEARKCFALSCRIDAGFDKSQTNLRVLEGKKRISTIKTSKQDFENDGFEGEEDDDDEMDEDSMEESIMNA